MQQDKLQNKAAGPERPGHFWQKTLWGVPRARLLFLAAVVFGIITLCSKCSPLYPFNNWVDANCFMTVGKSMLHGLVPYRDLFEHKGPLLYTLFALAALVSERSFVGVWLLELAAAFAFALFVWRALALYTKAPTVWTSLCLAVVYGSVAMCHGASAEEFCLPLLAFALYLGANALQTGEPISYRAYFAVGVTSGCVLWIKFSLLGFYVGWFVVPAVLMPGRRAWKRLLLTLVSIGAGVGAATLPFVVYFKLNHAIWDWERVYLHDNIFSYAQYGSGTVLPGGVVNFLRGWQYFAESNRVVLILMALGLVWLFVTAPPRTAWAALCTALGAVFFVYTGGQNHPYYAMIFGVLAPLGMLPLDAAAQRLLPKAAAAAQSGRRALAGAAAALWLGVVLLAGAGCTNLEFLQYGKDDLPQYQFDAIIQTVENPTLLNYAFLDGGFYTVSGVVPTCYYFCWVTLPKSEIMQTQNACAEAGEVDFIITYNREVDFDKYTLVAECTFPYEGYDAVYRLYERKDLLQ